MKVVKQLGTYQQREGKKPTIEWDEITSRLDARYVSAPEATWRIFQFSSITAFAKHHPTGSPFTTRRSVFFQPGQEENALSRAAMQDTTLTAYFKLMIPMQDNISTEKSRIIMFFITRTACGNLEKIQPESSEDCTR